jgi:hypothetical protein
MTDFKLRAAQYLGVRAEPDAVIIMLAISDTRTPALVRFCFPSVIAQSSLRRLLSSADTFESHHLRHSRMLEVRAYLQASNCHQ